MQNEQQNRKRGAEGELQTPSLSIPWSNQMNTVTQPVGQEIFNSIDLEKWALSLSEGGGLREYLSEGIHQLLQSLLLKERALYLQTNSKDVGNGFCPPRTIYHGTVPMDISVPRTRAGFYPPSLPKYQRNLTEPYRQLLRDLLLGTKSFAELGRTVRRLGLPYTPEELEEILQTLEREGREYLQRPLASDYLMVLMDAKVLYVRDEQGHLVKSHVLTALGVNLEGRKEILHYKIFYRSEVLETWKQALLDMKNRGLTRVGLLVTDDVSGLTGLIRGLFPLADHQLCTVHLLRNARSHLEKEGDQFFLQRFKEILASPAAMAREKFLALCETLEDQAPAFIRHIRERVDHYLAFTHYPDILWSHLRTTNAVEGLNNMIETLQRNAGGHFHTERETYVKMWMLISQLNQTKWNKVHGHFLSALPDWIRLFQKRYEPELEKINTQNS